MRQMNVATLSLLPLVQCQYGMDANASARAKVEEPCVQVWEQALECMLHRRSASLQRGSIAGQNMGLASKSATGALAARLFSA
eukprot:3828097-Amphidinium_carterae.1